MLSFDLIAKNDKDVFVQRISTLFISQTIVSIDDKSA
jgi:hypothetical protein